MVGEITSNPRQSADVHVCIGPWFAKSHWLDHANMVLLDRCYYRGDPEHVSAGWTDKYGNFKYFEGVGRKSVEVASSAKGVGTIFLADYNGPVEYGHDAVRLHPSQIAYNVSLEEQLGNYGKAVGYRTTALITAKLLGLEVETKDSTFILAKKNWHELLPYVDWHFDEIENGDLWEHLSQQV